MLSVECDTIDHLSQRTEFHKEARKAGKRAKNLSLTEHAENARRKTRCWFYPIEKDRFDKRRLPSRSSFPRSG